MAGQGSRLYGQLNRRIWAAARRAALDRDGWRCRDCGKPGRLEVHHLQPLEASGAPYELTNLRTLCRGCHIATHLPAPKPGASAWAALVGELQARTDLDAPASV